MNTAMARRRVVVRGRVQGVAFRHHTSRQAETLGVNGWVRNLRDGAVEGVFEGEAAAVEALVAWCRTGPPAAIVEEIEVTTGDYAGEFSGFSIRY